MNIFGDDHLLLLFIMIKCFWAWYGRHVGNRRKCGHLARRCSKSLLHAQIKGLIDQYGRENLPRVCQSDRLAGRLNHGCLIQEVDVRLQVNLQAHQLYRVILLRHTAIWDLACYKARICRDSGLK